MKYNTLGHTGLLVSELCLGTMTFAAGEGMWKPIAGVEQKLADELLRLSLDAGINFVDTADVYTHGESEKTLAQAIANLGVARKDIVIATKAYGRTGPGRNDVGASRGHIMDAVEASFKRLQTDYIDLYQIHAADSVTPLEETLRALDTLVTQGKVRYICCSNWYAWHIMKANGISEAKNLARLETLRPTTPSRDAISSGDCAVAHGPADRPVSLEPFGGRTALRQIFPRGSKAGGLETFGFRFSHCG